MAVELGRRLLFQLEQRAEQGLPLKSELFSAVIDDSIAYRERDHRHGKTSAGILRQIIRSQRDWRVRSRPQHGNLGADNSGTLRKAGYGGRVCNEAGWLGLGWACLP
jgi:hypothetical protein